MGQNATEIDVISGLIELLENTLRIISKKTHLQRRWASHLEIVATSAPLASPSGRQTVNFINIWYRASEI